MKVMQSQSPRRGCAEGGAICAYHQQTSQIGWRGTGLAWVSFVRCECMTFTRTQSDVFFFQGSARRLLSDPLGPLFAWAPWQRPMLSFAPCTLLTLAAVSLPQCEKKQYCGAKVLKPADFASGWLRCSFKGFNYVILPVFLGSSQAPCHELGAQTSGQSPGKPVGEMGVHNHIFNVKLFLFQLEHFLKGCAVLQRPNQIHDANVVSSRL